MYSTVPPWLRLEPSLNDRFNGRTRQSISTLRLRSGIIQSRGTAAFHHSGGLSGNLTKDACLRHSFYKNKCITLSLNCQERTACNLWAKRGSLCKCFVFRIFFILLRMTYYGTLSAMDDNGMFLVLKRAWSSVECKPKIKRFHEGAVE